MSSPVAIRIQDLSKKYYRNTANAGSLRAGAAHLWRKLRQPAGLRKQSREPFWALKDIDLEVQKGEILGIIGNNGAGKSTLLKLISRITPPTTGKIELFGRMASMLEVGTGFHMELTGRDNIFLNGAILGMKKWEIQRHFDEIVDFSGVESFIDSPLKYYSSGMQVRLAFAVAAFLQPEILLIDEVLAVGDVGFQQKCLDKMSERAREGITILFVSHDMDSVKKLCSSGVYLGAGKIIKAGSPEEVIHTYLETQEYQYQISYTCKEEKRSGIFFSKIQFKELRNEYKFDEPIPILATLQVQEKMQEEAQIWIKIKKENSTSKYSAGKKIDQNLLAVKGKIFVELTIPKKLLEPGNYSLRFEIWEPTEDKHWDDIRNMLKLKIVQKEKLPEDSKIESMIDCIWDIKHNKGNHVSSSDLNY